MADTKLSYPQTAAADTIDYKPLSLLAVAGLGLSLAYAAVLLIFGGASLFKSEPFFLSGWWFALPIGGAALSVLGLYQVFNSEGTRAGALLAKWGLGISAVAGLSYFTYHTVTAMAVLQQANRFLLDKDENSGFFPRLQGTDSDVNTAFLLTLHPSDRNVRVDNLAEMAKFDRPPEQGPKGMLTQFLETPLVRMLHAAPVGTVKIEALAVRSWAFEGGAFHIVRTYRITTDDAVYEVPVVVASIEPDAEGEKRRWRAMNFTPVKVINWTDLGLKRQRLRKSALEFLSDAKTGWLEKISQRRDPVEIYLGTQRPLDRKLIRDMAADTRKAALVLQEREPLTALAGVGLGAVGAISEDDLLKRRLSGYYPLNEVANYFKVDPLRVRDRRAKTLGQLTFSLPHMLKVAPDDLAPLEIRGGEVLITHQAQAMNSIADNKESVTLLMLVKIVLAATENLDPAAEDARDQWYVKSVDYYRALPVPQPKPPGT